VWLQGVGSSLLAVGIWSVVAATPFWSQISLLLHTFIQPVEGLYDKLPLLEEFHQNFLDLSKKGHLVENLPSLSTYCKKKSYSSMVFNNSYISYQGSMNWAQPQTIKYWGHSKEIFVIQCIKYLLNHMGCDTRDNFCFFDEFLFKNGVHCV